MSTTITAVVGPGKLGIVINTTPNQRHGSVISNVSPELSNQGVQPNDRFMKINDVDVRNYSAKDIQEELAKSSDDDERTIEFFRQRRSSRNPTPKANPKEDEAEKKSTGLRKSAKGGAADNAAAAALAERRSKEELKLFEMIDNNKKGWTAKEKRGKKKQVKEYTEKLLNPPQKEESVPGSNGEWAMTTIFGCMEIKSTNATKCSNKDCGLHAICMLETEGEAPWYDCADCLDKDEGGWEGWGLPIDFMSNPHRAAAQQFCSKKGNASMPNLPTRRPKRKSGEISTTEPPQSGNRWRFQRDLAKMIQDDANANGINLTEPGKLYPCDAKERVTASFLEKYPTAGTGISKANWKRTLCVARGGAIVAPKANSGEAGTISTDYKNTKQAITNGRDGEGFVKTFTDGEDGAKRCCEKFHKSAARVELYVEACGLGFTKLEAFEVLNDVMPAEEAMKRAVEVCGQDEDLSKLKSTDAATLVRELAAYEIDEKSMEDDADETDKENCITIFQSQACDIECKLFMAAKCIQKDIAFTEKRIDREFDTDYTALIIPLPKIYSELMCQGTAKRERGDPLDNENVHFTEGYIAVDIIGAEVMDFAAIKGTDGYTYSLANGAECLARIIPFNKSRSEGESCDMWKDVFPGTADSVQLHRVMLAAVECFGGSVHETFHYEEGGVLHGVLGEGETFDKRFECKVTNPRLESLITELGKERVAKNCDGDHLFGRNWRFLNSFLYVQAVSHRENITRSWVRRKAREWLFLLSTGAYSGGNDMPSDAVTREL